jgi:hypothetical protein
MALAWHTPMQKRLKVYEKTELKISAERNNNDSPGMAICAVDGLYSLFKDQNPLPLIN